MKNGECHYEYEVVSNNNNNNNNSIVELFSTCLCFSMGILHVIYLGESHASGQQGEKLPAYLLPSC